jgi:hypothetical protein
MPTDKAIDAGAPGPAIRHAARLLYDELAHAGFSAIVEWEALRPDQRDDFFYCMEGLLTHWSELRAARAELERHQSV